MTKRQVIQDIIERSSEKPLDRLKRIQKEDKEEHSSADVDRAKDENTKERHVTKTKKNPIVGIYHDPLTEKNLEAFGVVTRILSEDNDFYHVKVMFIGDLKEYSRKIRKGQAKDENTKGSRK